MNRTAVINVVGLTKDLIEHTHFLKKWIAEKQLSTINSAFPAVTCTAQSNYLTGQTPDAHGIIGNGWYFKDECEIKFWRQSNNLVEAPKIWELLKKKDPSFTCCNMFWWYNMYASTDYSVTPRPQYKADGRKIPDVYSNPPELRDHLQKKLGAFPLFNFWGPNTNIKSSKWIADASMITDDLYDPTLTLIYLPHLDYCLQKYGPKDPRIIKDVLEIDGVCKDLIEFYERKKCHIIVLSEYGITEVNNAIHLNREFRKQGLITVREENGSEILDPGASKAFAVADHQIAHVYINDKSKSNQVRAIVEKVSGIEKILEKEDIKKWNIDHSRIGDLVLVADKNSWFTYYYWLDDRKAPDFARTVEIHRKPGYDPAELFFDPNIKMLYPTLVWKLLKKKMGFRSLMDVIPLDATLVKGSHGRINENENDRPVIITESSLNMNRTQIESTEVFNIILSQLLPSEEKVRNKLSGVI